MSATLRRLLEQRRLLRATLDEEAVKRELEGAEYDLGQGKRSLAESPKIIQDNSLRKMGCDSVFSNFTPP